MPHLSNEFYFHRRYIDPKVVLEQKSLKDIFVLLFGVQSAQSLFARYQAYFHPKLVQRFLRELNPLRGGRWVHYDVQKTLAVNYIKYAARMSGIRTGSDKMSMLKLLRESKWPVEFINEVHHELFTVGHWTKDPRDVVVYVDEDFYESSMASMEQDMMLQMQQQMQDDSVQQSAEDNNESPDETIE